MKNIFIEVQEILWKTYFSTTCVSKNCNVCGISDFQDSLNRKKLENNMETNFILSTKFQNQPNIPLIIKQMRVIKLAKFKIGKSFL